MTKVWRIEGFLSELSLSFFSSVYPWSVFLPWFAPYPVKSVVKCAIQRTTVYIMFGTCTWFWVICLPYWTRNKPKIFPEILNPTRSWICCPVPSLARTIQHFFRFDSCLIRCTSIFNWNIVFINFWLINFVNSDLAELWPEMVEEWLFGIPHTIRTYLNFLSDFIYSWRSYDRIY